MNNIQKSFFLDSLLDEYQSNHSLRRSFLRCESSTAVIFSFLTFFQYLSSSCRVNDNPHDWQTICLIADWYFMNPPHFRYAFQMRTFWAAGHLITNFFFNFHDLLLL